MFSVWICTGLPWIKFIKTDCTYASYISNKTKRCMEIQVTSSRPSCCSLPSCCMKLRITGCIRKESLLFYFVFVMTATYFSITCNYTVLYCEYLDTVFNWNLPSNHTKYSSLLKSAGVILYTSKVRYIWLPVCIFSGFLFLWMYNNTKCKNELNHQKWNINSGVCIC